MQSTVGKNMYYIIRNVIMTFNAHVQNNVVVECNTKYVIILSSGKGVSVVVCGLSPTYYTFCLYGYPHFACVMLDTSIAGW